MPRLGEGAVALQHGHHHRTEGPQDGRKRREAFRGAGHAGGQGVAQGLLTVEEDLALVGEMPVEGALGDARPCRDLGRGDLVEAAFRVQVEGGLLQAQARRSSIARHPRSIAR
ncbi:hypothetical protein Airi01_005840 [Actinoallomurus iriomotensis]|uniref:Uncharacterized protein n=1 Tax=Actinoallomurus iriomotensis TaxID=478107 RepID=A0A9W6RDX3_9ACTN|nr:hypothetical protein Airi01_005840 [Actinoallomurus iriomotensis]